MLFDLIQAGYSPTGVIVWGVRMGRFLSSIIIIFSVPGLVVAG